jgi:hypothetical protein
MRLAAIAPFFCAVAFGQSAPLAIPLNVQPHLKTLRLLPGKPIVVIGRGAITASPGVCAVPLREALSPNDNTDYKIRVFRPAVPPEPQAQIMPPCK